MTTSMPHNGAKANWTLEELGWKLHDKGDLKDWDGLLAWFVIQIEKDESWLKVAYIRQWYDASLGRSSGKDGSLL